jgi:hypothetical protein
MKLLSLLIALFIISIGNAQKPGTITGTVFSSAKKVALVEAVITLTSPALEGSKIALTDSTGTYRIADLPPGVYAITFEMEGYRTSGRDKILLTEGMTIGINIEMARQRMVANTSKKEAGN